MKNNQPVPKMNVNNEQHNNRSVNILDHNIISQSAKNNVNQPSVKDVNDIFDLFSSNVNISDNNQSNARRTSNNKQENLQQQDNKDNIQRNDLNPNNIIDMMSQLTQKQQQPFNNITDLSQQNNKSCNVPNNTSNNVFQPNNNTNINDIKISNENSQNKKVLDLEELIKSAYSNNANDNYNVYLFNFLIF